MPLEYFDPEADTADVIAALKRDGATVVRNQVGPEVTDAVLAELRGPFDTVGKLLDRANFRSWPKADC